MNQYRELDELICGEIWTSMDLEENHRRLCLEYPGRFSGSPEGFGAAEYIVDTLTSYGVNPLQKETYETIFWKRGTAECWILSPVNRELPCLALPYSPACNREFSLVDLGMGHPVDLERMCHLIKGNAILVDDNNPPAGPHLHRLQKYVPLVKSEAGAFLFVNKSPGMLAPTGSLAFNQSREMDQALPAVGLPFETGAELRYWLNRNGSLNLKLVMNNSLFRGQESNIIADISGPDPNGSMVLITAHYDGHDISHASVDNASGTAVVMEIARVLFKHRHQLKGTVRCILFAGEEMGLLGSHHHVKKQVKTLDSIRFQFNLDCVGHDSRLALMIHNASQVKTWLETQAKQLPAPIDIQEYLVPFSDHFPFYLQGVPGAFCVTPGRDGRGWGHTYADSFEKTSMEALHKVAAYIARLVIRVDHEKDWRCQRQTLQAIRKEIEPYNVEELLQFEGHWPFSP